MTFKELAAIREILVVEQMKRGGEERRLWKQAQTAQERKDAKAASEKYIDACALIDAIDNTEMR